MTSHLTKNVTIIMATQYFLVKLNVFMDNLGIQAEAKNIYISIVDTKYLLFVLGNLLKDFFMLHVYYSLG